MGILKDKIHELLPDGMNDVHGHSVSGLGEEVFVVDTGGFAG